MKKYTLFALFSIFVLAYILRVLFLPNLALTFGYDQARDAYVSQQILDGDIKILGPPASTPGLYHGVFYYYLLAPAYLVGAGSPIVAAHWIALLNAATVFIVFYLAYFLSKKIRAGLTAAFLFAISFEATQYATWLSNPTIGVWTVPLIYLGLWMWIARSRNKFWMTWGPFVAALGLGLSIQANIFLLYHTVPLGLWLWVARKDIKRSQLKNFVLLLVLVLSTMVISEVKFGFRGLAGIKELAISATPSLTHADSIGDYLSLYLNQAGRVYAFNSYPGNIGYGGAFVLALIFLGLYQWNKTSMPRRSGVSWQPFLATWLFAHITVVTMGGTSTPFLMVGIGPAVSIIIALFLYRWWEKGQKALAVIAAAILIFGNLSIIFRENPQGSTLFAIQKDMLLSKQLAAIDYTYKEADGEPFSINSLTSPLWINIVWTYLYKWYGLPRHKYIPQWHGRDQVGQLDTLPPAEESTERYFLILEPMGGIPPRYLDETIGEEDTRSRLLDEVYFGELRVQKRVKNE